MFRTLAHAQFVLAWLAICPLNVAADDELPATPSEATRWAWLPTDRTLRDAGSGAPWANVGGSQEAPREGATNVAPSDPMADPPLDLRSLLRPRLEFFAEWEPEASGLAIESYDLSAQMPIYPVFGPPPPFIRAGYSATRIDAPVAFDLPASLHDFSLGLAWMRRLNDRWMARFLLTGAFASDMDNTSSDAWQVRAGGFALFRPNERWSWAFGALATGRDDLPVLPAVGVIWDPSPELQVSLMMPNPRIACLLSESRGYQHWGYVGGGISGGTWAYDRAGGTGERLSYREFRLVLGWEARPPRPPGTFRPTGTKIHAEAGYAFGRKFEFDRAGSDLSADDAFLLRTGLSF